HSHAYNLGIGFSRTTGPATFGLDAIYEPIWSETWAEAEAPTETVLGDTIPAGGRTIENHFRFSDALVRMGVGRELAFGGRPGAAGQANRWRSPTPAPCAPGASSWPRAVRSPWTR